MSGGEWGYLSQKFDLLRQEVAADRGIVDASLHLMGQIEHELDWGYSFDTCLHCAQRRVLAALAEFFSEGGRTATSALAILRDHQNAETMCSNDLAELAFGKQPIATYTPALIDVQRERDRRANEKQL